MPTFGCPRVVGSTFQGLSILGQRGGSNRESIWTRPGRGESWHVVRGNLCSVPPQGFAFEVLMGEDDMVHLLGLIALATIAACQRAEVVESVYPNAQAAIRAGAIERGWIPSSLPPSAMDIRECHNLDTNQVWLRFSQDPSDLGSFTKSCRRIDVTEVALPRRGSGDWWPDALTESQAGSQRKTREYEHYRCEDGASIAIHGDSRQVFYWKK